MKTITTTASTIAVSLIVGTAAHAGVSFDCTGLPDHQSLQAALDAAVAEEESGLDLHMWATIVDRDGKVCAVAA